jgi:amidophosphoribosyltransferase
MAVGHVRYGTTGGQRRENCQPIVVNHIKGRMALAHNGNLTNSMELRQELEMQGSIFHTTSDTEVISYVITKERISAPSIESAVNRGHGPDKGRVFAGDHVPLQAHRRPGPHGFRPLCIRPHRRTAAAWWPPRAARWTPSGARFIRDLEPGEIMVFDKNGVRSIRDPTAARRKSAPAF